MTTVIYDWSTGNGSGWGTYGAALARHGQGRCDVIAATRPADPSLVRYVTPDRLPPGAITLTGLGNDATGVRGGYAIPAPKVAKRVGVIFSEDTAFTPEGLNRLNRFDLIVAGSEWNAAELRAIPGLKPPVEVVLQGVDPTHFFPPVDAGLAYRRDRGWSNRIVVFSGGKLEYRKGQDIAIAAFREFRKADPRAHLVTAWHNLWPETLAGLHYSSHLASTPTSTDAKDLTPWLDQHGIPPEAHTEVGLIGPEEMGKVLRGCDLAIFPNRAEGGTNLVAMEAMACGVPTILSDGTGHRDVMATAASYVNGFNPKHPVPPYKGNHGWVETHPSAFVDRMQEVPPGPLPALDLPWERQVHRLLDVIGVPA